MNEEPVLEFPPDKDIVDVFGVFRDYVKHEDELINRRLSWNLTLQGFLFAAYGVSLQVMNIGNGGAAAMAGRLKWIIPAVGALVSVLSLMGVAAAEMAIRGLEQGWRSVRRRMDPTMTSGLPGLTGGGRTVARILGGNAHSLIPIVIMAAWILILIFGYR